MRKNKFKPDYKVPIGEFVREAFYLKNGWDASEDSESAAVRQTFIVLEMMRMGFTAEEISLIFIELRHLPVELCSKLSNLGVLSHTPEMIERLDRQYYSSWED